MIYIIDKNTKPSFYIDDSPIFKIANVIDISENLHPLLHKDNSCFRDFQFNFGWQITTDDSQINETSNYYYYIDTINQVSFGHWATESAIHLFKFNELKKQYPNIKLLVPILKKYKKIFFKLFEFNEDDIVQTFNKDNNIFFFSNYINHHDPNMGGDFYKTLLVNYFQKIKNIMNTEPIEKDISILFFTRTKTENCSSNDRTIINENVLVDYISQIPNTVVYNPEETKDILEQFHLVSRAKTIILEYGSSFSTNGLISENANIIVIGLFYHTYIPASKMITELIIGKNKTVIFTPIQSSNNGQININIEEVINRLNQLL